MSIEYLTRAAANEATTAQAEAGTATGVYISPAKLRDGLNASGSAPVYACRAWVNFNGTGTVAIRESGNVSSITDNGTGNYTVNFTTAMPDANYSVVASVSEGDTSGTADNAVNFNPYVYSTGSVQGITANDTSADRYSLFVNIAIFRQEQTMNQRIIYPTDEVGVVPAEWSKK